MNSPRKVVVLGSHSFSGQDFIDLLLDQPGYEVIGISRSADKPACFLRFKERSDLSRYRFYALDLNRQMEELTALLDQERPDWIVNFAAQSEVAPSWETPEDWFQTNTVALARLVNHLSRRDYLERYLHVSSPEVYGTCVGDVTEETAMNPSTPYAASKAAADFLLSTYARQFGFPLLTVRATNVYGPGQQLFKIIPRSFINIKLSRTISLHGGGKAVKSYIQIRDVSRGEFAILEKGDVGKIYHLSPDEGISIRDLVQRICQLMNRPFDEVTEVTEERPGQDAAYVIDSKRARMELGWSPLISLDAGLLETQTWIEENWQEIMKQPHEYQHRT